jgi:hypothetical protein
MSYYMCEETCWAHIRVLWFRPLESGYDNMFWWRLDTDTQYGVSGWPTPDALHEIAMAGISDLMFHWSSKYVRWSYSKPARSQKMDSFKTLEKITNWIGLPHGESSGYGRWTPGQESASHLYYRISPHVAWTAWSSWGGGLIRRWGRGLHCIPTWGEPASSKGRLGGLAIGSHTDSCQPNSC